MIYTDSETWAGDIHPVEALRRYRAATGIAARLIVVGMVANRFSIADPDDAGMLDVVGFDTSTPEVIAGSAGASCSSGEGGAQESACAPQRAPCPLLTTPPVVFSGGALRPGPERTRGRLRPVYSGPIVDCDIHHDRPSKDALLPHLSAGWREYATRSGGRQPMPVSSRAGRPARATP